MKAFGEETLKKKYPLWEIPSRLFLSAACFALMADTEFQAYNRGIELSPNINFITF